jgi:hypothetical protein
MLKTKIFSCLGGFCLLASTIVIAKPALAGSCINSPSRSNCDGKDPQVEGCGNNAYTIVKRNIVNDKGSILGFVELRYSPSCQSNWSKVTRYSDDNINDFLEAIIVRDSDNARYRESLSKYKSIYSPMVYAPKDTTHAEGRVCVPSGSFAYTSECYLGWTPSY